MTTPDSSPRQPDPRQKDRERIAANAALLRLFKGEYRESSDRHSDALFAIDYFDVMEAALAQATRELGEVKEQIKNLSKDYWDVADAVCAESTSPAHVCEIARAIRQQLARTESALAEEKADHAETIKIGDALLNKAVSLRADSERLDWLANCMSPYHGDGEDTPWEIRDHIDKHMSAMRQARDGMEGKG